MRVHKSNTYIDKHENSYAIFIAIPDDSRNYLHSQNLSLEDAIRLRSKLIQRSLSFNISPSNTVIEPIEAYYRIKTNFVIQKRAENDASKFTVDTILDFHSRKLNLNDAIHEHDLLTEE